MNLKSKKVIAEIGIFGGSGFYDFLEKVEEIEVKTPYGKPSDKIAVGEYNGKKIAFLPRHGKKHIFPPHKIPYRANIWAFKDLGIKRIIAPSASGSLNIKIKPGDFVICDQFIDKTKNRIDTFYENKNFHTRSADSTASMEILNRVAHVSAANPYCENLRKIAANSCKKLKIPFHNKGTVVVIEGPRFSTTAESLWFQSQKWEVINMTQYPENILARELEMCYTNISLITDYDAGLFGNKKLKPVDLKDVIRVFNENNEKIKKLIFEMIKNIPSDAKCSCEFAMENAFF